MKHHPLPSLVYALLLLAYSCTSSVEKKPEKLLGSIYFEADGSEKSLPWIKKGMLLLHSFEYEDAREAFLKAQELDSTAVMGYWGEAMTYNHPLWRYQGYDQGKAALQKLAPTRQERLAKAGNEKEKGLLEAVEILYAEAEKFQRDKEYAEHLEGLYQQFRGDHEIAAFYALSLLGSVPVGRSKEAYEKSASIVKGILQENPNHPGALHYLIHSYDDPGHARLALSAADSYAQIAPDAAHALHMPSHIYVAMGMWEEVISSNIDSWKASLHRRELKKLDGDARSYHALHWLLYGYAQKGQFNEAKSLLDEMVAYTTELPSKRARDYLVVMKANYLAESNDWSSSHASIITSVEDLNISTRALYRFLEGYRAYWNRDQEALYQTIVNLEKDRKGAANLVTERGVPMCSSPGSNGYAPNQLDVDQAYVMEMELKALKAMLENKKQEVEKWLHAAVSLEDNLSYSFGPPIIAIPSYELYGNWLWAENRSEEAAEQFDKSLTKGPKRLQALVGRLKAAKALNQENVVTEIENLLKQMLKSADPMVADALMAST